MGIRMVLARLAKGIAVPENKTTSELATQIMPVPHLIRVPMQQHIGAPSVPVVKKGDRVMVGTLIGMEGGRVSANVHSGVSGIVRGIEPLRTSSGKSVDTVVIEADGEQIVDPAMRPPIVRDRDSFLHAVAASGLVGLGGAGFPTAVKLSPVPGCTVDTLIINAAECEPYLTSDEREMLEHGDTVLSGLLAVIKYLNIPKVVIAVERNKPEAMDLMFSLTKGDPRLSVMPLSTRYPQGAEKVMIETVTGRQVPHGKLPAHVGVLMMNVTSVSVLGKYLLSGLPLVSRRITVDGSAVVEPKNVEVIVGTPIQDVLDFCGGFKFPLEKLVLGGPMMGEAMQDLAYPITKQNNGILALSSHDIAINEPKACVRCARCVDACPVGLSPVEICDAYEKKNIQELQKLHADLCIACGSCSFVCPSKILVSPSTVLARKLCAKEAQKQ